MKNQLQKIYKANQCTDLNDIEIAIKQINDLKNKIGWTPALINRMRGLKKRKAELLKSNLHPIFEQILKPFMQ